MIAAALEPAKMLTLVEIGSFVTGELTLVLTASGVIGVGSVLAASGKLSGIETAAA